MAFPDILIFFQNENTTINSVVDKILCIKEGTFVSTSFNKPSQEGLYQHFRKIADATPLPQGYLDWTAQSNLGEGEG